MLKQFIFLFFSLLTAAFAHAQQNIPEQNITFHFQSPIDLYEYVNSCSTKKENDLLNNDEILECYHKIFDGAQQFDIDSLSWLYAYHLGHRYRRLNNLSKAYYFQNIAYSNSHLIHDKVLVGRIKNVYGLIHKDAGETTKALEYFLESIDDFNKSDTSLLVAKPLSNISSLYKNLGDYQNAIRYKKKSIILAKQMTGSSYDFSYTNSCTSLAATYLLLGKPDSVAFYLNEALPIIKRLNPIELKNRKLIFYAYKTAAMDRIIRKDFKPAKAYIELAEQFVFNKRSRKRAIKILQANYALELDDKNKLFAILQDLESVKGTKNKIKVLELKIKTQEKYKLFKEAAASYKLLLKNKEKIIQQENHNYMLFNTAKFEAFEKQKEINKLKKQQKLAQLTIEKQTAFNIASIALLITLSIGVFSFFYLFRQKSKYNIKLVNEVNEKTLNLQTLNQDLGQKNEELQRFNYMLSHDLKEPIRSIVGFSRLLYKEIDNKEKLLTYSNFIASSGKQLHSLINYVNDFQSIDHVKYKPQLVNMAKVVEEVKKDLTPFIEQSNAVIENDNPLEIPNSSRIGIKQILTCILENGIHYNESKQPTIHISYKENQNNIFIIINDNGIGIAEQYFEQIFIMFKRLNTRDKYNGSGIGLALCQKVANRIGAQITILESQLQVGSKFQITINKHFQFEINEEEEEEGAFAVWN